MIDIETYCGICGAHCCGTTDIDYGQRSVKITIECPGCTSQIQELTREVEDLEEALEDARG